MASDLMAGSPSELRETGTDREAWRVAVPGWQRVGRGHHVRAPTARVGRCWGRRWARQEDSPDVLSCR